MSSKQTLQEYYMTHGKYRDKIQELMEMKIGICDSALEHYFKDKEMNEDLLKEIDARIEKQALKNNIIL